MNSSERDPKEDSQMRVKEASIQFGIDKGRELSGCFGNGRSLEGDF